MEDKKVDYNLEQIEKMSDIEWQNYRKSRWEQKCHIYNDENNIPDWFWIAKKDSNDGIRQRTWKKRCQAYSNAQSIATWFMPDKNKYLDFLKKIAKQKEKYNKKNNTNN